MDSRYAVSLFSECFIELIMGSGCLNDIILNENKSRLLPLVSQRIEKKKADKETYSYFSIESALLVRDVLELEEVENFTKQKAESIYHSLFEKYGLGPSTKYAITGYTYVHTPFGQSVQGIYHTPLSTQEYLNALNFTLSFDPDADILEPPTSAYNCHSYAWNVYDGGELCWINPYTNLGNQNLEKYWYHDYFDSVNQAYGDKVVYGDMDHSAVKDTDGYWVSKWGAGPLVRHTLMNMPYDTSSLVFFGKTIHTVSLGVPPTGTVSTPIVCSPEWLANVSGTSCIWSILDHHENDADCTQSINGVTNTVTFSSSGAFQIHCDVYWNSELVGQGDEQIIVTY